MKKSFILLSILALAFSCTREASIAEAEAVEYPYGKVTITTINEPLTKTDYAYDGTKLDCTWSSTDAVEVYYGDSHSTFNTTDGTTFTGSAPAGAISCVYPAGIAAVGGKVSLSLSTQAGTLEGLKNVDLQYGGGTVSAGAATVAFAHELAILHFTNLKIYAPEKDNFTRIEISGSKIAASAQIDLSTGTLTAGAAGVLTTTSARTVPKSGNDAGVQILSGDLYVAIVPLSAGDITEPIKVTAYDETGLRYSAKFRPGRAYEAGHIYRIDGFKLGEYVDTGDGNECSLINFDEPAGSAPSPCWFQSWASDGATKVVDGHDSKVYSAKFTPWSWQSVAACTRRERLLNLSEWTNIEFDMYIDNANPQPWSFLPKFFNDPNAYMDGDEYARKWVDKSGFVDKGKQWIHIVWPISSFEKKKGDDSYTKVRAIRIVYGGDKGEKDEILFDNIKLTR